MSAAIGRELGGKGFTHPTTDESLSTSHKRVRNANPPNDPQGAGSGAATAAVRVENAVGAHFPLGSSATGAAAPIASPITLYIMPDGSLTLHRPDTLPYGSQPPLYPPMPPLMAPQMTAMSTAPAAFNPMATVDRILLQHLKTHLDLDGKLQLACTALNTIISHGQPSDLHYYTLDFIRQAVLEAKSTRDAQRVMANFFLANPAQQPPDWPRLYQVSPFPMGSTFPTFAVTTASAAGAGATSHNAMTAASPPSAPVLTATTTPSYSDGNDSTAEEYSPIPSMPTPPPPREGRSSSPPAATTSIPVTGTASASNPPRASSLVYPQPGAVTTRALVHSDSDSSLYRSPASGISSAVDETVSASAKTSSINVESAAAASSMVSPPSPPPSPIGPLKPLSQTADLVLPLSPQSPAGLPLKPFVPQSLSDKTLVSPGSPSALPPLSLLSPQMTAAGHGITKPPSPLAL